MTTTDRPDEAPPIANVTQDAAWNGPEGAHWAEAADAGGTEDVLVEPLLDAARIGAGDRVLDVGCGTGDMTRRAARRAHRGSALGVDLSSAMLDAARAVAAREALANVRFEVGDAQVHPFAAGSCDVAVSHFGIMFFDDPVAAFANIGRALRPGGRLAFVCPQAMERCDWYVVPLAALLGRRPTDESAPSRMFSLASPPVVEDVLGRAGFVDIRLESADAALHLGPDLPATVDFFAHSGPVRSLREHHPNLTDPEVHTLLTEALHPYATPTGVRIPGAHHLFTAHRPEPSPGLSRMGDRR